MEFLVNAVSILTATLADLWNWIIRSLKSLVTFFDTTWSIIKTLWFWIKTLLSWTWSLIQDLFNWSLFDYLANWFNDLQLYIGFPWVIFMFSILFVIMIRIIIAFVFRMFRLNVDYKTMKTKRK